MSISNIGTTNILTVICDICFIPIDNDPTIRCITCKIDQCIYCFCDGLETKSHKNTHSYSIVQFSKQNFQGWTILEELIFYNSLDKYGIGNWNLISKTIGTKTEEEVEMFFYAIFNITKNTISTLKVHERNSNPFRSKISIFMNNREDFDVEYMNDYEEIIKDIDYTDSDEEIDILAKNSILKGYGNIIKMRKYRKDIILEKQLIDVEQNIEFDKKMSRYLDIDKYKFLLEYLTLEQYKEFLYGISKEKELLSSSKYSKIKIDYKMALSRTEKKFC